MFAAVVFDDRNGTPIRRANWLLAYAALAYSGVPKAGAPVFMSTFEVKPPYIAGTPGCTSGSAR